MALTIIVSSVSSALALVQSSLTSTRISGSQVTGANLAREGLEVVRAKRDTNWLSGTAFFTDLISGTDKTARPLLDTSTGEWTVEFSDFDLDDNKARLWRLADGTFVQTTGGQPPGSSETQYRRIMTVDHVCRASVSGDERVASGTDVCGPGETLVGFAVTSQVSFIGQSGNRRSVEAEGRLYDWR